MVLLMELVLLHLHHLGVGNDGLVFVLLMQATKVLGVGGCTSTHDSCRRYECVYMYR